jgi:hypothetical protein
MRKDVMPVRLPTTETDLTATITRCSNVDLRFDDYTVRAWDDVASKHRHPQLWTERRQIERKKKLYLTATPFNSWNNPLKSLI